MRILLGLLLTVLCTSPVWAQSGDPCAVMPKSNVAVSIASATTTSLIAPVTNQAIYVCGVSLTASGTSPTIQFEYGTGATCGTGTQTMSGIVPIPTAGLNTPTNNATTMVTPVSQRLCAVSAGTSPQIHGYLSYIQW